MAQRAASTDPVLETGTYNVGAAMGNLLEFTDLIPTKLRGIRQGRVVAVRIRDDAANGIRLSLHLFDFAIAGIVDGAPYVVTELDARFAIGSVRFEQADWEGSTVLVAVRAPLALPYDPPAGTSLFGVLEARQGGMPYAVDDMHVTVTVEGG